MHARLALKTSVKITPQQILTSRLLQAAAGDLEQLIRQELAENPALEQCEAWSRPTSTAVGSPTERSPAQPFSVSPVHRSHHHGAPTAAEISEQLIAQPSAIEQLINQVACSAQGTDLTLAVFLLDSLDERGYLRTPLAELAQAAGVAEAALTRARQLLHELEPPGIGARDLRECLQLQYNHLAATGMQCSVVGRILSEAWDEFSTQQWAQVARKLKVSRACVADAQHFIRTNFYPYPLALVEQSATPAVTLAQADLIIQCEKSANRPVYSITIANAAAERLRISPAFMQDWGDSATNQPGVAAAEAGWLTSYIDRARHFLQALNQRGLLLRRIGEYLVDYQTAFLAHGPRHLKPLTQNQVAVALDVHESTISRAVHDKHALLPNGRLLPLSAFFDHSLPAKAALQRLLAHSDHPISDRELADALRSEGIDVARRTVAKYREQLRLGPLPLWN